MADHGDELPEAMVPPRRDLPRAGQAESSYQEVLDDHGSAGRSGEGSESKSDAVYAEVREVDQAHRRPEKVEVPPERRDYILNGSESGGGHRFGTGRPQKSEFPQSWDDDRCIDSVVSVAQDPSSQATRQADGRWRVDGERDGVEIRAVVLPDGTLWTGFPTNTPRNPREG